MVRMGHPYSGVHTKGTIQLNFEEFSSKDCFQIKGILEITAWDRYGGIKRIEMYSNGESANWKWEFDSNKWNDMMYLAQKRFIRPADVIAIDTHYDRFENLLAIVFEGPKGMFTWVGARSDYFYLWSRVVVGERKWIALCARRFLAKGHLT